MIKNIQLLLCVTLFLASSLGVVAQDDMTAKAESYSATPDNMWEVGLTVGHSFTTGDFDYKPGFGGQLHLRKAIDYIFSLRGAVFYKTMNGESTAAKDGITEFAATYAGGNFHGLMSLNNLFWRSSEKKINLYALGGASVGVLGSKGTVNGTTDVDLLDRYNLTTTTLSADVGVGIAFKINKKFNIGVEHVTTIPFGKQSDFVDGFNNKGYDQTSYRDIMHFTGISLNINLGNAAEKVEPLYWVNPMETVMSDIAELKARPILDLTDTDMDGVIDMMDQEVNSVEGAIVDTRGVAMDSDKDGVLDHMDEEPYSMPGYKVNAKGVAQIPAPEFVTASEVNKLIDGKLKEYDLTSAPSSITDWFLPMIHFDLNSSKIKSSAVEKIHQVATVMRNNPSVTVAVSGYTDKSASDSYNQKLSYKRAMAAINYLVTNYGISRDRLVLNYAGENENLVPSNGANYMNRRVEFKVATNETEMGAPAGVNFNGNIDAGY